jgi:dihydropteroate synthase
VPPAPHPLDRLLAERRPLVMGILNLTPDSFADGGRFLEPAKAVVHAERMIAEGADIIDVGAESTRPYPGMRPVSAEEELARLMPVLPQVVALGIPVSIDTIKAEIAARAIAVGATIVNDVWGLQRDPDMAGVVAAHGVPVVVTHNRETVDAALDIMSDMNDFFSRSLEIAWRAGIGRDRIVLDPGIGFGKTPEQSLTAIARLGRLRDFGLPLLIGLSRKRFINAVVPSKPQDRLAGSLAGAVLAVLDGAAIVRTHDVAETVQALRVAAAIRAAR